MHRDHAIPLFRHNLLDGLHWSVITGIIDENIDGSQPFLGDRDDVDAIRFARNIRCDEGCSPASLFDFSDYAAELRFATRGDQHGSAFRGESLGDGAPDSAPAAGDHGNFALQKHAISHCFASNENSIAAALSKPRRTRTPNSTGALNLLCGAAKSRGGDRASRRVETNLLFAERDRAAIERSDSRAPV